MRLFLRTKQYPVQLRILQSSEKCYPSTILYYKVLLQKVLLQYYSVLQSTTSYYKVLVQYYSVLQSTTPVLLRTTNVLQSTSPVLLRTTKYYSSTSPVLQSTTPVPKDYSSTTSYYKVLLQ